MREEKVLHGGVIKSHSVKETQKDEREKILRQYLRVIHRQFTPALRDMDLVTSSGRKAGMIKQNLCFADRKKELLDLGAGF